MATLEGDDVEETQAPRSPRTAKMTERTLLGIVSQRCAEVGALGGSALATERATALRYYRGEKFGNEQEGRSQVVSRDVAESIDSTLPSLMRIFAGGDQVVLCEPNGPEDEDAAQQATDYANYVWNRQNPGFRIFYWMFKDALLQKLGIVKVWWDESEKITHEEYEGLTPAQADELRADPNVEVVEETDPYDDDKADEYGAPQIPLAPPLAPPPMAPAGLLPPPLPGAPPGFPGPGPMPMPGPPPFPGAPGGPPPGGAAPPMPMPMMPGLPALITPEPQKLVDMVVKRTNKTGRICVENVPNEEFGMSKMAISVEDADYTHHRRKVTLSYLRQMGFKQSQIDAIPADDLEVADVEKQERFEDELQGGMASEETGIMDPSMRKVWLTEAYLKVDFDGDGTAEMRMVTWAGNQIFVNEECDENPFAACTPTLMPHKAIGLSMADQTMDLQLVKSTLWRNFLDNVYLQSAPALAVNDDAVVDMSEWLTRRVGQVVRTKGAPAAAFAPLPTQFVGSEVFPAIEYIDSQREQRTGTTRYNQGLDANSLNKTATGINMIQQAAGQRIELIARSFAETGVKPAFRKVLKLASQYSDRQQVIRLRGKWVNVDPRAWANGFDMSVSVGLGTGNKDQQVAHMSMLLQVDQQIIQMQGGLQGPLVTGENLYNKLEKLVQAMGLPAVEPFYTDPESPDMKAAMAAQAAQKQGQGAGGPEVEVAKVAAGAQLQAVQMQTQAQAQTDVQKAQIKAQTDAQATALKMAADERAAALDRQTQMQQAALKAESARQIEAMRLASKEHTAAMQASLDMATERFKAMLDAHTAHMGQMQAAARAQQPQAPAP